MNPPVSIILAARNEEQNIRSCVKALIDQNYPEDLLQIVIVDDGSTDETVPILKSFESKVSDLTILQTHSKTGNKKLALDKAIRKCTGEILLFTDADCVPSAAWVQTMVNYFSDDIGLVAGFSPVIDPSDSFFGKILHLDSIAAGFVAAGAIGNGSAATCTGRNLGYRRQLFQEVNGFSEIQKSTSGDDDLFLQLVKMKTHWNINYAIDSDAIVPSYQTKSFVQFINQKKRHLSAGKYYNRKNQFLYLLFHLSNLSFFVFPILSVWYQKFLISSLLLIMGKLFFDWVVIRSCARKFQQPINFNPFLVWEIFFPFYHLIIAPLSWFGKIRWK